MDLTKLTLGDKIATACGIVLIIDLLFLPWHRVCVDYFGGEACGSASAIESPNGFLGHPRPAADDRHRRRPDRQPRRRRRSCPSSRSPILRPSSTPTIAVLVILLLKLIIETDDLGFGAWLGILLAGGMTYGGFLIFQSEGSGATPTGGGLGTTAGLLSLPLLQSNGPPWWRAVSRAGTLVGAPPDEAAGLTSELG